MTELRFPDPPLADDTIRLRPWSETDVGAAWRATQDPLIPRFTRVPENQTEDDLRRFLAEQEPARSAGESLALAITDAGTDTFLHTASDNHASQRVAERCGFIREGLLRSYEERQGRRCDLVVYSLLPDDLE